jgi:isocitrate dehydrogenase kinase/phosphatase
MPSTAARIIDEHVDGWHDEFRGFARKHATHFARAEWREAVDGSGRRLQLYDRHLQKSLGRLRAEMGDDYRNGEAWARARAEFSRLRSGKPNVELAETFFNSHTRRIFATVGVEPAFEYVAETLTEPRSMEAQDVYRPVDVEDDTAGAIREILEGTDLGARWEDTGRDARLVAASLDAAVEAHGARLGKIEMLDPVFYRNKGAYLIGRVRAGDSVIPVILPVLHAPGGGLRVDTALLTSNEASQVFSFTRSYFAVDVEQPWAVVRFLKSLMPLKRIAELYISLGFVKHGKTELYRDLSVFLDRTTEKFARARGTPGMVMSVFTLPDYDVVFKLIKDRFDPVKQGTREDVRRKYRFVALHDRVGRLADFQEYERLEFPVERFEPGLLEQLLEDCASTVRVEEGRVIVRHVYTERRVTPLNIFLQEAPEAESREAVLDAGYAVKDMAAANLFPGDMLVKNFGVTRHGRVIFYDYDELDHLTEFNFREKPQPRDDFDMMSSEPWFYVGPNDIFPEEIGLFMGFPQAHAELFCRKHGDLLTVEFWTEMQARQEDPEPVDLFPYPPEKRFHE